MRQFGLMFGVLLPGFAALGVEIASDRTNHVLFEDHDSQGTESTAEECHEAGIEFGAHTMAPRSSCSIFLFRAYRA